jgi:surface carbohydrate biosynthesis protein (TIGR04326 family)
MLMIRTSPRGLAVVNYGISASGKPVGTSQLPRAAFSEMWVCFARLHDAPPPDVLVLSFMAPSDEFAIERRWPGQVVSGRAVIQDVRTQARAQYVDLIARLGSLGAPKRSTLRQILRGPGEYSRWWLLPPTEKDCIVDDDPIYTAVLRGAAVRAVQNRYAISQTRHHGTSPAYSGGNHGAGASLGFLIQAVARGVVSRFALVVECFLIRRALRRLPEPDRRWDVLLQAYWDWSLRPCESGGLTDRYFADLPQQLARRGLRVGWLASFEPSRGGSQPRRSRTDLTAAASRQPNVVIIERFLTAFDILRDLLDPRYAIRTTRAMLSAECRQVCRNSGIDVYPQVSRAVIRAAWGATCGKLQLVATAVARTCGRLRPSGVLTFLEMSLRARAFYAGIRAGSPRTHVWAAQHAGYSSDKTLGVFDAECEIRGLPDDCPVPAPDGIFVMGSLSRRIWERNLGDRRVIQTGGLRYQTVAVERRPARTREGPMSVLLVGGMNEAAEMEVCDATTTAAAGLPLSLRWRDHPYYLFSQRRAFERFRESIAVTSGSADEDLAAADLVIFTHSGLAEEALLRGIPTWQWLWLGFNTSPFLDLPVIPSFTSVNELRLELQAFVHDPRRYSPDAAIQQQILEECFGSDPSLASARVADAVQRILAADGVAAPRY